ncbi:MAG: hypothetical protein QOF93_448 [Verrucomicrobiota bacterium]
MKLPTIKERKRFRSPAVTPQALAWDGKQLWMSSRDLGFFYKIDIEQPKILDEKDPPGVVWAAVFTNDGWRLTVGKGLNDDRYVYRYDGNGRFEKLFACPDLAGSYLSYDGESLYLSQWYEQRILKLDKAGHTVGTIEVGAEICGHVFAKGAIYVLRGTENVPRPQICRRQADSRAIQSGSEAGRRTVVDSANQSSRREARGGRCCSRPVCGALAHIRR